jgi:hypothetical protein
MRRNSKRLLLALASALIWLSAQAHAQPPYISYITPQPQHAGTPGSSLNIQGDFFGSLSDSVFFPGVTDGVNPWSASTGSINVTIPPTWSGTIYLKHNGISSNSVPFEVTYNWSGQKWFVLPFTWHLNQNGAPGCNINDTATALNDGYSAWTCASDASVTYGGTTALTGEDHHDGWNVQYWGTAPWSNPNLIAVATFYYWIATNEIIECDIHYNGADWSWSIGGSPTTCDVQNIATHEEGHTLGLLDLYGAADSEKTMFGGSGNNETKKRTLHRYDVEGAEYMYPRAGRPNLAAGTPTGWWGPIVPRNFNDATTSYAPLPSSLAGNAETFVNVGQTNNGLDCAAPIGWIEILLDDVHYTTRGWAHSWANGLTTGWTNMAITVPSGRHTYKVVYDLDGDIIESSESDNVYQAQFAWSPYGLADQVPATRAKPPSAGNLLADNCDGFMFTGNWWGAVGMIPTGSGDDYDLDLFNDYVGSTQGYQTPLTSSTYVANTSDFVWVNGNLAGYGETRWVGVRRWAAPSGGNFVICQSNQVGPTVIVPGDNEVSTGNVTIGANQIIKVHEFYFDDIDVTYTFTLVNHSGTADLDFAVYDPQDAFGRKSDFLVGGQSIGPGAGETFDFDPPLDLYYGVIVWKRGTSDLALANTYEIVVAPTPPNLNAQITPAGFSSPLVPRNGTGAGYGNAPLTLTLDGNSPTTWLNFAVEQEGPNDCSQWYSEVFLYGEIPLDGAWSGEPVPPTSVQWTNRGPVDVRGGRHTLTLRADDMGMVAESNEADNSWTGQWIWSPLVTAKNVPVIRPAPPPRGPMVHANCDGMQFTHAGGMAWVVGMVPLNPADDFDLIVYDDYSGSTAGFSHSLNISGQVSWDTDFIVGHYYLTPLTVYPAVVEFTAEAIGQFVMDQSDADGRNGGGSAEFIDQVLEPLRLVDVYEAYLEQDQRYYFRLLRIEGESDLAFGVFPAVLSGVYSRAEAAGVSVVWSENEDLAVYQATETGWHPVVVYRPDSRSFESPVVYHFSWQPTEMTAVDEPDAPLLPQTAVFLGPSPNPMTASTQLVFALPRSGRVRVDMYDARGRRVRQLADRHCDGGRQAVAWNGCDDQGRPVAAGVYWARMIMTDRTMTKRVTVLR